MAKVMINGATGLVGENIVRAFLDAGHTVRASDRPGADFSEAPSGSAGPASGLHAKVIRAEARQERMKRNLHRRKGVIACLRNAGIPGMSDHCSR